jgi:predicted transcriptional regulator
MPTSNLPAGIILTSMEWFVRCLTKQCTVFHFPPGRKPKVKNLAPGSICLILVRPSQGTPREEWTFVGELVVKSVKLVSGKEFQDKYALRAVEIDIPFPKPRKKAWIIEFEQLVKYERPVKLKECTGIKIN